MKNSKTVCDRCGHPAAFRDEREDLDVCGICAHVDQGEKIGEAYASAQVFAAAAQMAMRFGVRKHELHSLLAEALDHESRHEPLDLSFGTIGVCDERR